MKPTGNRHEQAAFWFLRLREADIGPDEIDAALAWLAESAENHAAFDAVERVWTADAPVPADEVDENIAPTRRIFPLARIARVAAVILVMVGLAVGLKNAPLRGTGPTQVRYATMVGETRDHVARRIVDRARRAQ